MALIKCSECQKEVSSDAIKCPNCGNPINSENPINIGTSGLSVAGIICSGIAVLMMFLPSPIVFILSIILWLIGIIFNLISIRKPKKRLPITGLIINGIYVLAFIIRLVAALNV